MKTPDGFQFGLALLLGLTIGAIPLSGAPVINGSFEQGLDGWTPAGNVSATSSLPYVAAEGTGLAAFNGANTTPDGTLVQEVTLEAGRRYMLRFQVGVLSYNLLPQALRVRVEMPGHIEPILLDQTAELVGNGGGSTVWVEKSYEFVPPVTFVRLEFADASANTLSLDLLLDDVSLTPAVRQMTVTSALDEDDGMLGQGAGDSLREVLAAAADPAGYLTNVDFAPELDGATIVLGGTELCVGSDVVIDASGLANGIAISANQQSRVLHVGVARKVVLRNLLVRDGLTGEDENGTGAESGAGILIDGNGQLTVEACRFENNHSGDDGGAISNRFSKMIVAGSRFEGNQAAKQGGAIATWVFSETTISDTTISGNTAGGSGGGISNAFWLTIHRSTVSGNHAGETGGGIRSYPLHPAGGLLDIHDSTLTGNEAALSGGAVHFANSLRLENSTVVGNDSQTSGGGIFSSASSATLANSVVAMNTAPQDSQISGDPVETPAPNFIDGNPMLAPLADYGGGTFTMPPLPGSPVIEAGVPLESSSPADQRGSARPNGPLPDLGAVEAFPFSALIQIDEDGDGIDDRLEPSYGMVVGEDDSARDSDGDGSRDAEEIANMTGLNDGESRLKILSFAPVEGAVEPETYRVTFTCFPGLGYAVEAHPEIDFTAPEVRVIPFGVAAGYTGSVDAALMPGRDFLRVRRD